MIRIKTLSLPLISALVSSAALPASAQVGLSLSSQITYRQNEDSIDFKGGSFRIRLNDGAASSIRVCNSPYYYDPSPLLVCGDGTTGYVSMGSIGGSDLQRPYVLLTSLQSAIVIEPLEADRIKLTAAPASKLPRPSGGFTDDSASVFYNLTVPNSIQEYGITRYFQTRNYTQSQRTKFEQEIVTGVYQYSFPRLNAPNMPAVIKSTIYPMAEGLSSKNNRSSGFEFTSINQNEWTKDGYIVMSGSRPNVIRWKGLTPSSVFAAVDKLFFSMKALRNPRNPENSDLITETSIFPAFTGAASDSRIQLPSPYQTSFTVPPLFPSGLKAMVQLDLVRNFQTGGVTYDFSSRKFQIPVVILDTYKEYASIYLANERKKKILADADGDGFNNMTEWILDSDAADVASIPIAPVPASFAAVDEFGFPDPFNSYFGFNVDVKRETIPAVRYKLQISKDQGRTWESFRVGYHLLDGSYSVDRPVDDNGFPVPYRWHVQRVTSVVRGVTSTQIQVRSGTPNEDPEATVPFGQPVGTQSDIYRVKITLDK
jgi:hypothetical protein